MTSNINSRKYEELSFLRIFGTILVIFTHAFYVYTYGDLKYFNSDSVDYIRFLIEKIINSFNMPIFCAISGFLFAFQIKQKEKIRYSSFIKKKFKRLIIPYIAFAPITLLSVRGFLDFNLHKALMPIGHLWFLMMLFFTFVLVFPIKRSLTHPIHSLLILLIAFLLSAIPFPSNINDMVGKDNILAINDLKIYLVTFIIGTTIFINSHRINSLSTWGGY